MKLETFREWDVEDGVSDVIRGNLVDADVDAGYVLARYLGQFLVIDQVYVGREYRGRGLGLMVVDAVIKMHGDGCDHAVLEPFPIRSRTRPKAGTIAKLQRHWGLLGFAPGPEGPDYWLALDRPRIPVEKALAAYRRRKDEVLSDG